MWTKLRNVVRGVAQFKHAVSQTCSRSAASASGEHERLGRVRLLLAAASLTCLSLPASAVADGDHLSHGSADSSTEANSEERTLGRGPEDATDNGQSAGTDGEDVADDRLHRLPTNLACLWRAGRQSDQGYGSKDELHQDPADPPLRAVAPDDQDRPKPERNGETNAGSGTPPNPNAVALTTPPRNRK